MPSSRDKEFEERLEELGYADGIGHGLDDGHEQRGPVGPED